MFIVNRTDKEIFHTKDFKKISSIKGNYKEVYQFISSEYKKESFNKNIYINSFNVSKKQTHSDCLIYHLYKNSKIIVDKNLIYDIGMMKVLLYLFGFSFQKISFIKQNNEIELFSKGNMKETIKKNVSEEIVISSFSDLVNQSFLFYQGDNSSLDYNTIYAKFSYVLGNYDKNNFITNISMGIDENKDLAKQKALSEAIERISCSIVDKKALISWNEKINGIDIIKNYMNKKEFNANKKSLKYIKVENLYKKQKKYICSDILYYPYTKLSSPITNSNGTATHMTKNKAIKGGILELIERDSFLLMWLLKKNVYKIANNSLNKNINKKINYFSKKGIIIHLFVIKFDNPMPVSFLIGKKNKKIITSLGTGINVNKSILKCLEEFIGMSSYFEKKISDMKEEAKNDSIKKHIYNYLSGDKEKNLNWLIKKKEYEVDKIMSLFQYGKFNLEGILKYYDNIGIQYYYYQFNNYLNNIFDRYTCKVFSEDLLPIYFGSVPSQIINSQRLDLWKEKTDTHNINNSLHPFG